MHYGSLDEVISYMIVSIRKYKSKIPQKAGPSINFTNFFLNFFDVDHTRHESEISGFFVYGSTSIDSATTGISILNGC